ncbi:MAG TPA: ATP-binding protein, partial [Gemmatimonadaceae bacterium]|nr:ATP-binding protein [Gemmatimonadaceae bacterium]
PGALARGWRAFAAAGLPTHAAIGYTLAHAAWLFLALTGPHQRALIGDAFFIPVGAAMAVMAWVNARDPRLPEAGRTAWRWLAAAYFVFGISNDIWAVNDVLLGRSRILRALVDGTTAIYLVLLTRGILAFNPVRETKASETKIALDFATIFIGAAALIWYFMLRPRYAAASELTWTVASSLLSPVGDLLGVVAIAFILIRGSDRVSIRALSIIGAGHLSMVAADLAYTPLSLSGTYRGGNRVDVLWMIGDALVFIGAAYQHRIGRVSTVVPTPLQRYFARLPYLFIVIGYLPILVAAGQWTRNDRLVLYATVVLTVLVLARQFVAMRDNEELSRERELQEARFRSLVQRASDTIAVVDADGIIRYLSGSAERLFGYAAETHIGEPMTARLHPQDVAAAHALLEQARAGANPGPVMRLRVRHRDGSWIPIETVATNMLADPAVEGIVLNARDVSERVALEAQLLHAQKMDAVGRLAGGIAHDFNNLLTAIRMTATLVIDELPPGSPLAEELREIERSVDRGSSLTRQLLAFSKRELLQPTLVDPAEVIAGIEPMLRRLIATGIVVEIDAPLQEWRVFADQGQLEQVVLNLAINARDAIPESGRLFIGVGATTIDVATARGHPGLLPGDYVTVTVRDSGIGMSPEVQAHLFEPFFTTKEVGKGTGLGLSTVYAIVQRCGGTIHVHSTLGEGSTFTVYLPRAIPDAAVSPASVLAPTLDVGREVVLVVDDEETVRMAVRRILQKSGYRVLVAANGVEALEQLGAAGAQVALVLTDMVMPEMGGRELVDRVVRDHPGVRILCMSGYTEDPTLRLGQLAGEQGFIAKPFTVAELTAAIRRVLDGAPGRAPGGAPEGAARPPVSSGSTARV